MTWLIAVVLSCIATCALAREANLVKLDYAVKDGAVCLDGSPPGYYYREGELGRPPSSKEWLVDAALCGRVLCLNR